MKRRDFVRLGWATMIATGAGKQRPALGESLGLQQVAGPPQHLMAEALGANTANVTLMNSRCRPEMCGALVTPT
jgi:hypothetical protein